ncbi:PQQ-dependent sugar dehydrogenase, partial [Roseovarius sp.]
MRLIPLILAACLAMSPAFALDSSAGKLTVEKMVDRLNDPWAIGFLPDGGLLITEKAGRVIHIENGQRRELGGLPDVATRGQGGLLDV